MLWLCEQGFLCTGDEAVCPDYAERIKDGAEWQANPEQGWAGHVPGECPCFLSLGRRWLANIAALKQERSEAGEHWLQGAKIGFLGQNGSGKSSLMRVIAGVDKEFEGDLRLEPGVRIGYLPQEPQLDDSATVLANIEPAVKAVKHKLQEFEEVRRFRGGVEVG